MRKYATSKSDRVDTTVTEVRVRRGDTSAKNAAVRFVVKQFPECAVNVLGAWMTGERHESGDPIWAVEWEDVSDAEA